METLYHSLSVPANHQISLTLPHHIPVGEIEMVLVIHSKPVSQNLTREETLRKLVGLLKQSSSLYTDAHKTQPELPPITRSLVGSLRLTHLEEPDYHRHLEDKYL
jgi:hypothetical protein